ncbi:MAG: UvrD-helicase domain-containing protein [Endomicrobiales bacterium]|nr:UvrD-helicase domain-containing protein [Endomicrobiales bacterium]
MNHKTTPQIHILEASAGSGKTYALSRRYVGLLINPKAREDGSHVRNILAITFTNKAAIEMKSRIFELLKNIALDTFGKPAEKKDILDLLGVPEEQAKKRAFALLEHIIRNYGRFRVQTVDSFINEIISGSSFRLGLSARFDIKTDHKAFLERALDAVIENSATDARIKSVLKEFITQYIHIEKKAGWFARDSAMAVIEDLYDKANTYGAKLVKAAKIGSKDVFAQKKKTFELIKELSKCLPDKTNSGLKGAIGKMLAENNENFAIDGLSAYFRRERFPLNKGGVITAKAEKLWEDIRSALSAAAEKEGLSFYNCYAGLFGAASSEFDKAETKDDVMFLGELNRKAQGVFEGTGDVVPELYYRMSARFDHLLIDEFQDTSTIQWRNIRPMAEEILAKGGSLFYVGDKKQAIYRFRGGDAGLFDSAPGELNASSNLEILGRNYRSAEEIVRFNNGVFSEDNLSGFLSRIEEDKDDDEKFTERERKDILKVFSDSKQERPASSADKRGGFVGVKYLPAKNKDERDAELRPIVTGLVRNLSKGRHYKDIAVLARENRDVELFTGWLLAEGIPAESEKTLNLRENRAVKELVAFLSFLAAPVDNVAFGSFLLGDAFPEVSGRSRVEMESFIFNSRQKAGANYLYVDFREQYAGIWEQYFDGFFVSVGFTPVYELAVSVLSGFRFSEIFPESQGFVSRFLELVKESENEFSDLKSFLEYFAEAPDREMFVKFSGADSVKLLTVHKAKGLEFPVVVIPSLEIDISPQKGSAPGSSYFTSLDGDKLSLIKLNKALAAFSEKLGKLYSDNIKKSLIDELNSVYVALTRAKEELYVFVPEKSGNSKNKARFLLTEETEAGVPQSAPKRTEEAGVRELAGPAYGDWTGILKREFPAGAGISNRKAMILGDAVHYGLSFIGNLESKKVPDEIDAALERVSARYTGVDMKAVEKTISSVINRREFAEIFFVKSGRVFSEREVLVKDGSTKRIDRLIVKDDEIVVVDYKSSKDGAENHKKQINEYIDILKGIYPGKKIFGKVVYFDTLASETV